MYRTHGCRILVVNQFRSIATAWSPVRGVRSESHCNFTKPEWVFESKDVINEDLISDVHKPWTTIKKYTVSKEWPLFKVFGGCQWGKCVWWDIIIWCIWLKQVTIKDSICGCEPKFGYSRNPIYLERMNLKIDRFNEIYASLGGHTQVTWDTLCISPMWKKCHMFNSIFLVAHENPAHDTSKRSLEFSLISGVLQIGEILELEPIFFLSR